MTYKLTIQQGATFRQRFVYKAGETVASAAPVDLTGCTARAQMRPDYASDSVWAEWTTENGGISLGGPSGTIDMFSSAAATAAMPADKGVWDMELVFPSGGDTLRILEGQTAVTPEVTK